jgi:hypothetical protein
LIKRHQMLRRVSARHQDAKVGLDRIRLHGVLLQMVRCDWPKSYGDSASSFTPLLAPVRPDRRRRVPYPTRLSTSSIVQHEAPFDVVASKTAMLRRKFLKYEG